MTDSLLATLSAESLLRGWTPRRVGRRVIVLGECASTNDYALEVTSREVADGLAVLADQQTAGRGRQGRVWVSPRAASVLCSVVIEEPMGGQPDVSASSDSSPMCIENDGSLTQPANRPGASHAPTAMRHSESLSRPSGPRREQETSGWLTLAGAVAGCEAIRQATDIHPAIKWPNDLRVNGRKLGGVLIESRAIPSRGTRAWVVGIGINCLQQAGHFPPELRDRVTSLEMESHGPIDRAGVARALLTRLDAWLEEGSGIGEQGTGNGDQGTRNREQGTGNREQERASSVRPVPNSLFPNPSSLHARWLEYAEPLGGHVRLASAGREYSGRTLWVDPAGGLVVQCDDGTRAWFDPMQTRMI